MLETHSSKIQPKDATGLPQIVTIFAYFVIISLPVVMSTTGFSIDLNSHLVRYGVVSDHFQHMRFADNYIFDPGLLPNLGMDIIGTALVFALGLDLGLRVVYFVCLIAIPTGFFVLSYCVRGRIRAIDYAIAPFLAYSGIFVWGFANFLLGAGIALGGLGLWIAKEANPNTRAIVGIFIGLVLIVVHAFAFAIWGIMIAAYELEKWIVEDGKTLSKLIDRIVGLVFIAFLPVVYFVMSRTSSAPEGPTVSIENIIKYDGIHLYARIAEEVWSRLVLLLTVPDSGVPTINLMVGAGLLLVTLIFVISGNAKFDTRIFGPLFAVVILWAFLPPKIFGSGYANDRMPIFVWSLFAVSCSTAYKSQRSWDVVFFVRMLAVVHLLTVSIVYAWVDLGYRSFSRTIADTGNGKLAIAVLKGGADRSGLLPYCSGLELLAFSRGGYSVPTFDFASQQPLRLVGPLKAAMVHRAASFPRDQVARSAVGARAPTEAELVRKHFSFGFDMVIVCGSDPITNSNGDADIRASGLFWRVYSSDK